LTERRVDAVFAALADPTRREVMRLLADAPQTATQIAAELPVSRQAVAKHLATLEDAGLVAGERLGREVRYRLTPRPMADAVLWMTDTAAEWDRRLEALRRHFKR
jgi:DNA-binding transcriptional ArsR family regulator